MKEFNIELAKKGDKVCTRCGFIAIYDSTCKDKSYKFTIYDKYMNFIMFHNYAANGKFITIFDNGESEFDLFMAEDSDFQPKDEKPVYYRGNPARGSEIIADLIKRGGKNLPAANDWLQREDEVYYIDQFGMIRWLYLNEVKDSLDRCTELHLPPKKVKKEGWICLLRSKFTGNKYLIPAAKFYDTESIAKDCASKLECEATCLKTIKIDWEEEEK